MDGRWGCEETEVTGRLPRRCCKCLLQTVHANLSIMIYRSTTRNCQSSTVLPLLEHIRNALNESNSKLYYVSINAPPLPTMRIPRIAANDTATTSPTPTSGIDSVTTTTSRTGHGRQQQRRQLHLPVHLGGGGQHSSLA